MGTRGAFGFRKDNTDKVMYNHCDSYPGGLGSDIMEALVGIPIEKLNETALNIELVSEEVKPTSEQIELCRPFAHTDVSTGKLEEWYCLLRKAQGNISAYFDGLKYMIDCASFLSDSLFCEYAYIVNLDTNMFEIYQGFNKTKKEMENIGKSQDISTLKNTVKSQKEK